MVFIPNELRPKLHNACLQCGLADAAERRPFNHRRHGRRCRRDPFDAVRLEPGAANYAQVGQRMVFFPQGFAAFVAAHHTAFNPECFLADVPELLRVGGPAEVEVLDYEFCFPLGRDPACEREGEAALLRRLLIFQHVKLRFCGQDCIFTLPFHPAAQPSAVYLVPLELHERCRAFLTRGLQRRVIVQGNERLRVTHAFTESGSLWQCLAREGPAGKSGGVSPWELPGLVGLTPPRSPCWQLLIAMGRVLRDLAREHPSFAEDVDTREYRDYLHVVPVPISLSTIRARCTSGFYLTKAQLQRETRLMRENSVLYNGRGAPVTLEARRLERKLLTQIDLLDRRYASSIAELPDRLAERRLHPQTLTSLRALK